MKRSIYKMFPYWIFPHRSFPATKRFLPPNVSCHQTFPVTKCFLPPKLFLLKMFRAKKRFLIYKSYPETILTMRGDVVQVSICARMWIPYLFRCTLYMQSVVAFYKNDWVCCRFDWYHKHIHVKCSIDF